MYDCLLLQLQFSQLGRIE